MWLRMQDVFTKIQLKQGSETSFSMEPLSIWGVPVDLTARTRQTP